VHMALMLIAWHLSVAAQPSHTPPNEADAAPARAEHGQISPIDWELTFPSQFRRTMAIYQSLTVIFSRLTTEFIEKNTEYIQYTNIQCIGDMGKLYEA